MFVISLAACVSGFETASAKSKGFIEIQSIGESKFSQSKPELLVFEKSISGGHLVARLDANDMPFPGDTQGFKGFVFPSALAIRGADLYIADSGARKMYRFDTATQVMSVVPGEDVYPWSRMQVGQDRSLYVLDSARRIIRRHPPGGQPVKILGDPLAPASLDGFVVDERAGGIIASDNLNHRLLVFNRLGGAGWPIAHAGEGDLPLLGAMAGDGRTLYGIDNTCACIVTLDESGRVIGRMGQGEMAQPQQLAVDRHGHIFVYDAVDRTLKIFLHGNLIKAYGAQILHFTEISGLAVYEEALYIADGPGSQVLVFRIQPSMDEQMSRN